MAYLGRQPNTGVRSRYIFTATASQTTFSGSDDDGKTLKYEDAAYLDVFLNGVLLKPVTDYTATSKTSVVLTSGAAVSDIVEIVAYDIANIADTVSKANGGTFDAGVSVNGTVTADGLTVDTNTLYVDAANNRVGVGTASPSAALHVYNSGGGIVGLVEAASGYNARMRIQSGNANESFLEFADPDDSDVGEIVYDHSSNSMRFNTNATEAMRIDSSGALCIGKTTTSFDDAGVNIFGTTNSERINITRPGTGLNVNRLTSDGNIIGIYRDGTLVGSIASGANRLAIGDATVGLRFVEASTNRISPWNLSTQADRDNAVDLGESSSRFDDIYATNATIQTSDLTLKTAIASLTDAEITAAKAISKLFKTFKWNDAVEAKGDNARTHTGVIAQDVQQAMTDAGLDAGNYAFFIRGVWWEADETYTDDDGVEQTRTNSYATLEEAPEGATERTRLGIRYPELLAFIGAATEQRLTSIEARLATLENA